MKKVRCIIYGLNTGRLIVEESLSNQIEIIGYSDSYYDKELFLGKTFYKPEELSTVNFDFIIIAIGDKKAYEEIYNKIKAMGINANKIIKFFYIYCIFGYDEDNIICRDNMVNNVKNIEGLVLGISHGRDAIDINDLKGNWCNLAIGSQDLYYNYCQIKHLVNEYYEKIRNLKYVIIDMYTYTYFNYDVSLSSGAIDYYFCSGFNENEKHNFDKNNNFKRSIQEHIDEINSQIVYWKKYDYLFNESFNSRFKLDYLRKKEISDKDIEEIKRYKYSSIETKRYTRTIQENIKILEKMIKTLTEINRNIKIYMILIPQYIEKEKRIAEIEKKWKKEFYEILNNLMNKYEFKVLDFKKCELISADRHLYYNDGHLNFKGQKKFTKMLNMYIK